MYGSRLFLVVRLVLFAVAAIALDAAAYGQDVNSCVVVRCSSSNENCVTIDTRRCANPAPRQINGACTFASVIPGCENPDSDGDGLADVWEDNEAIDLNCDGFYDSNDVALPGANKRVKDVFLKLSYMQSAPNEIFDAHRPSEDSIQSVKAAFAGAHLTSTVQSCVSSNSCPAGMACLDHVCLPACNTDAECGTATNGGSCVDGVCQSRRLHVSAADMTAVPHSNVMSFGPVNNACIASGSASDPATAVNFYDIKANPQNFDPKEAAFKRYGVFGHFNTCDSPESCATCPADLGGATHGFGTSGLAELIGNDFVVTLGAFPAPLTQQVRDLRQSGTLMHELGHTLGLCHGGPADDTGACNSDPQQHVKPNQISVMNYAYNFGIPTTNDPGTTKLGPMRIDFSHAALGALDEASLNESTGVSPGFDPPFNTYLVKFWNGPGEPRYGSTQPGTPIDWNGNGVIETSVSADINNDGAATAIFTSAEEWSRLVYPFQCSWTFVDGAEPPAGTIPGGEQELDIARLQQMGLVNPPPLVIQVDVSRECIDVTSNGVIPVTLFGSTQFDVTQIIPSTLRVGAAPPNNNVSIQDKDGDGVLDLSGRFRASAMQLAANSTFVTVSGKLMNGQSFLAYDTIKVVAGNPGLCQK